jgi:prephenate dehydrogenase
VEAARPDLFRGRLCFLTPVAGTKKSAIREVQSLWQALEMRVVSLSPPRHDRITAAVSHLPHLAAAALVNQVGDQKMLGFAGTGLADLTRVAASDPLLWLEIIRQNRENILRQVELLTGALGELKGMLEEEKTPRLRAWLRKARLRRRQLGGS